MSCKKHKHELSQHKYKHRSELLPTLTWHQLEPPAWGGKFFPETGCRFIGPI